MSIRDRITSGGRRGTVALALALLLAGGGAGAIAWAATHQEMAPVPAASSQRALSPPSGSAGPSPAATADGPHLAASVPTAVSIPAIGVHSDLQRLGLQPDGTLQTPQPGPHYDEAAWFDGSATPGQLGVSVLEGHVDSAANGPSVFFRLGALRPGDAIAVARADGSTAHFAVDSVREFPKSAFPTTAVYGGDPHQASLRLITCGGPFDRSTRNYLDDIVVYAHLTGTGG